MADDTASSPEGNINGSNDLSTPLLHSASSPSTTSTIDADDRYDTISPQRSVASRTSLASTLASTLFGGGSNEKSVHPEKGATYADDIEGRSLDRENHQSIKKLNAFTLAMIIYFNTAGKKSICLELTLFSSSIYSHHDSSLHIHRMLIRRSIWIRTICQSGR